MRLATTVWSCIGAVVVGYFATVTLGALLGVRNESVLSRVSEVAHPAAIRCRQASSDFDLGVRSSESAVVFGDRNEFEAAIDHFRRAIDEIDAAGKLPGLDPRRRESLATLRAGLHAFVGQAVDIYGAMSEGRSTPELQAAATALSARRASLRASLVAQAEAFTALLRGDIGIAVNSAHEQRYIVLVVFVLVVVATLTAVAMVMARLSRRLDALMAASHRLAQGDYQAALPPTAGDELGRLTGSFARMREAVQVRDRELRAIGEDLEQTVERRTRELADKNAALSAQIAERERAERSLRLLESAVGQISEGVVVASCSAGGGTPRVIYVNQGFCAINGMERAAAPQLDIISLGASEDDRAALAALVAAAAAGEDAVRRADCRRGDGSVLPADWHATPVRGGDGEVEHMVAIQRDISEQRRIEEALAEAHRRTIEASHEAGKAEVATSVLHNVGNVLNSVNVSVGVVADGLAQSRVANLARAAAMLVEHAGDLPAFLTADERGRRLPGYLVDLGRHLDAEHGRLVEEVRSLGRFVDHIKDVIALQQGYARAAGVNLPGTPEELCEDALRVHLASLDRLGVEVERDYRGLPRLLIDRSRVLQVLINLIANARHALATVAGARRLRLAAGMDSGRLRFIVADNGVGITPEHMARLFTHGFTTRSDGHGFGLHASALAAREMGGSLTAASDGPGRGATFTLEIPAAAAP